MLPQIPQTIPVIAVSYFRPNDLRRSFKSVINSSYPIHYHLIDNSHGGLDLGWVSQHQNASVYLNCQNLGKGMAVMRYYGRIVQETPADWIVSIDTDIEVPPNWLWCLLGDAMRLARTVKVGIIAPLLKQHEDDDCAKQLESRHLHMHRWGPKTTEVLPGVYFNRNTAGPVFLINRAFFEKVGGFATNQLYGNDDGELCAAAARTGHFVGFTSNLEVLHLNADSDAGYEAWKARNVRGNVDHLGYWD